MNHNPFQTNTPGPSLSDPLVIKVASIPATLAASVGYRVTSEDPQTRQNITTQLSKGNAVKTLRMAQIAADIKGSQAIYRSARADGDPIRYQLTAQGGPVAIIHDRNSIGDIAFLGGQPSSTVSRFWTALQEYTSVLGRLKRRLSTVVIYSEKDLKRTLNDHDEPDNYLSELTGEIYLALGNTGVLAIDGDNSASVLNLDIGSIDKAVQPWKQLLLASAGGLTEDQLWGGSDRPVGLSGADEQGRRAVASTVDSILEGWTPFLNFAVREIAYDLGVDWETVSAAFNPYDSGSVNESLASQKLAAEADKIALETGVLTVEEVRASRHGGEGFGVDITLASEPV